MEEKNPYIEPPNYFEGYNKELEKLNDRPDLVEFDRMCYELFATNKTGKKWIEHVKEKYLIPKLCAPGTNTFQIDLLFFEGFKEFPRMIMAHIKAHAQRIANTKEKPSK